MTALIFRHPGVLFALPLVGLLYLVQVAGRRWRRRDVDEFRRSTGTRVPIGVGQRLRQDILPCLATAAIIAALAQPVAQPHPEHPFRDGRDVVFVVDVSNSMLAADVPPNRLARAKLAIADCVRSLEGRRVGLVVFSGTPAILCPLTTDHTFFYNALEAAGPDRVRQGGTDIQTALQLTCDELLSDAGEGYRDVVLISDGGDRGPLRPAATASINDMGVTLIAVGIGSGGRGSRIPDPSRPGQYMLYRGEEVWTRLEDAPLRQLAAACERGYYVPVGTSHVDLAGVYRLLSSQPAPAQRADDPITVHRQAFQPFIALALVALLVTTLGPPRRKHWVPSPPALSHVGLLLLALCVSAHAGERCRGWLALRRGDPSEALGLYRKLVAAGAPAQVHYNLGNACYRLGKYPEAAAAYREALSRAKASREVLVVNATYNLATTLACMAREDLGDPRALPLLSDAVRLYHRVLEQTPDFTDAAVNLELVLRARASCRESLRRAREAGLTYRKAPSADQTYATRDASDPDSDTGAYVTQSSDNDTSAAVIPYSPREILEEQRRRQSDMPGPPPVPRERVRTDW